MNQAGSEQSQMDFMTHVKDWNNQAFGPNGTCLDCEEIQFDVTQFAGVQKLTSRCRKSGEWVPFRRREKLTMDKNSFKQAKAASYSKGRGAWIFMRVTLRPDAEPIVEELFDREIVGTGMLDEPASAGQLVADLAMFPRTRDNIPDWMVQTIEAADQPVPVLDLETDTVVMGKESWPYEEPAR